MAAFTGAGAPGTDPGIIGPHVESIAAVAKHFDVAERTAASWIHAGATTKTANGYSIPHIEMWRRSKEDKPATSGPEIITAGLLRALMHEIVLAFSAFVEEVDDPDAEEKFLKFFETNLNGRLLLSEEFIRGVASELHFGNFFDKILDDANVDGEPAA